MKYNITTITAKPGEQLRIRLTSKGVMPKIAMSHNVVVLKKEARPRGVRDGRRLGARHRLHPGGEQSRRDRQHGAGRPGETVEVVFKVPAVAGSYPFLCTFPGHFVVGMKGNLVVK